MIDSDYGTEKRLVRDLQAHIARLREALEEALPILEAHAEEYTTLDGSLSSGDRAVALARAVLEETAK